MTEDTDERMDRAKRIRQMREGQRENAGTDDAAGDADAEPSSDESTTDEAPSDELASDEPSGAETADGSDADSDADGAPETTADPADEATAAAQRAAQAASQVTGGVDGDAASPEATTGAAAAAQASQPAAGGGPAVPTQVETSVELPDQESIQAAIADAELDSEPATAPGTASGRIVEAQGATAEETTRVLEFTLGEEHYCLDIAHVEEIVKRDSITRVPNTPDYVEGVVDLRGQITTILDPKRLLDIDGEGSESLLVVFEPEAFEDQGAIGWVVDEVRQVVPVPESAVTAAPVDADYVEGVIDRDDEDEFVIWTNPEVAIELATGEREGEDGA